MKYPAFNEYQAALQHPSRCLVLPAGLQNCVAETDLWGLPRVRSGGFALTYKLTDGTSTYALRCFHKHVSDRADRYASINRYIQRSKVDYLEAIQYIPKGIVIKGASFPVTYMKWVEGETLESYVIRNLDNPARLEELASQFYQVVLDLEQRKITHGDLSHHNIMVRDSKLVLVDYDGMNVPEMKQTHSCEIGNPHFQHPGRDETLFDLTTDRFSSIVIYMALKALAIDKKFWYEYETGGEGLLFRRADFEHPWQSPLLQEMETIASLNQDVRQFSQICLMDVHQVPRLEEFVNGLDLDFYNVIADVGQPQPDRTVVLDAQKKYLFASRLGEIVTVVGRIEEVFTGLSRDKVPQVFINFGNWKVKCFTVVLWDEALNLMQATGIDPQEYKDKWVSVTGLLTSYKRRPQMMVNTPFDIEILDEERVNEKIAASSPFWFVRTPAAAPQPARRKAVQVPRPAVQEPALQTPSILQPVIQPQTAQVIVDGSFALVDLDAAQVANPLDLNNDVVGKINDLYKNRKPEAKANPRKKKAAK